jgi:hypothetical protein
VRYKIIPLVGGNENLAEYVHGSRVSKTQHLYYYIWVSRTSYNAFGERDSEHLVHPITFNISTSTFTVGSKEKNHYLPFFTTLLSNCQIKTNLAFLFRYYPTYRIIIGSLLFLSQKCSRTRRFFFPKRRRTSDAVAVDADHCPCTIEDDRSHTPAQTFYAAPARTFTVAPVRSLSPPVTSADVAESSTVAHLHLSKIDQSATKLRSDGSRCSPGETPCRSATRCEPYVFA